MPVTTPKSLAECGCGMGAVDVKVPPVGTVTIPTGVQDQIIRNIAEERYYSSLGGATGARKDFTKAVISAIGSAVGFALGAAILGMLIGKEVRRDVPRIR